MIQGTVKIDSHAFLGSGISPPLIGLKQVLNGTEYDWGPAPYYLTQFCPASISLGQETQQLPFINSPLWNQGNRTGVGNYLALQANPGTRSWDSAPFWENLSTVSDSCPAPAQTDNICGFHASQNGYIDDAIFLKFNNQQVGPTENVAWDQHYFYGMQNALAGGTTGSCSASCRQWLYCGNTIEGIFSVDFTLYEIPPGVPYTLVSATVR